MQPIAQVQLSSIKPILKNSKYAVAQNKSRVDQAGNEIIKGGNHQVTFNQQPNQQTTNIQNLSSDSSDSDIEFSQNEITQSNKQILVEEKRPLQQPEVARNSQCCILF